MIGKKVKFHSNSLLSNCEGIVQSEGATKGIYMVKITALEINGRMSSIDFLGPFGLENTLAFEEELEVIN